MWIISTVIKESLINESGGSIRFPVVVSAETVLEGVCCNTVDTGPETKGTKSVVLVLGKNTL